MFSFSRARVQEEAGFSLIEMLVTMVVLGFVMTGLANIFISGERASADGTARLTSQQNVNVAFTRLEYDARCASTATLLNKSGSNGGGVYLAIPAGCAHASGNVTWCVTSGTLVRIAGTTCSGTGVNLVSSVTTATPFSCYTAVTGAQPQLKVALTVNSGGKSDATSATDYITFRNNWTTTGSISSGSSTLTLADGTFIKNGDAITVAGAGAIPSGSSTATTLLATVSSGGLTTTLTLGTAASTTVSGAVVSAPTARCS